MALPEATVPVLAPDYSRELRENGFVVVPGPPVSADSLSDAYDRAVMTADPADVSVRSSTRVHDFVNRGPEFDGLYIFPPILAACCRIIRGPFKLSTMLARTLEPGTAAQPLHVDVKHRADGWPLVGFIVMVDAFTPDNGATRFVPGSHLQSHEPNQASEDPTKEVLACGPAGSIIIFNGSVWHGHAANRSSQRRRSIQGAFIPRSARAAMNQGERIRPETLERIGELAKYLLELDPPHRP